MEKFIVKCLLSFCIFFICNLNNVSSQRSNNNNNYEGQSGYSSLMIQERLNPSSSSSRLQNKWNSQGATYQEMNSNNELENYKHVSEISNRKIHNMNNRMPSPSLSYSNNAGNDGNNGPIYQSNMINNDQWSNSKSSGNSQNFEYAVDNSEQSKSLEMPTYTINEISPSHNKYQLNTGSPSNSENEYVIKNTQDSQDQQNKYNSYLLQKQDNNQQIQVQELSPASTQQWESQENLNKAQLVQNWNNRPQNNWNERRINLEGQSSNTVQNWNSRPQNNWNEQKTNVEGENSNAAQNWNNKPQNNWNEQKINVEGGSSNIVQNWNNKPQNNWNEQKINVEGESSNIVQNWNNKPQNNWNEQRINIESGNSNPEQNWNNKPQNHWNEQRINIEDENSNTVQNWNNKPQNNWNEQRINIDSDNGNTEQNWNNKPQNNWNEQRENTESCSSNTAQNWDHKQHNNWNAQRINIDAGNSNMDAISLHNAHLEQNNNKQAQQQTNNNSPDLSYFNELEILSALQKNNQNNNNDNIKTITIPTLTSSSMILPNSKISSHSPETEHSAHHSSLMAKILPAIHQISSDLFSPSCSLSPSSIKNLGLTHSSYIVEPISSLSSITRSQNSQNRKSNLSSNKIRQIQGNIYENSRDLKSMQN